MSAEGAALIFPCWPAIVPSWLAEGNLFRRRNVPLRRRISPLERWRNHMIRTRPAIQMTVALLGFYLASESMQATPLSQRRILHNVDYVVAGVAGGCGGSRTITRFCVTRTGKQ